MHSFLSGPRCAAAQSMCTVALAALLWSIVTAEQAQRQESAIAARALEAGTRGTSMAAATGTATGPASAAAVAEPKSTMLTTEAPQIIEHCQLSITYSPTDVRWVPSSARFVAIGEKPRGTGALQVYELDGGKAKLVHEVSCVRTRRWVTDNCALRSLLRARQPLHSRMASLLLPRRYACRSARSRRRSSAGRSAPRWLRTATWQLGTTTAA